MRTLLAVAVVALAVPAGAAAKPGHGGGAVTWVCGTGEACRPLPSFAGDLLEGTPALGLDRLGPSYEVRYGAHEGPSSGWSMRWVPDARRLLVLDGEGVVYRRVGLVAEQALRQATAGLAPVREADLVTSLRRLGEPVPPAAPPPRTADGDGGIPWWPAAALAAVLLPALALRGRRPDRRLRVSPRSA